MSPMIFRADLHLHTHYSYDSFASPEKILSRAKSMGLSAVAVTDHNTVRGWKPMQKASKSARISVILGEEVRAMDGEKSVGEIIGLFLTEKVRPSSPQEIIDSIRSQGGIVVVPHPFDSWRQALESPERYVKRLHAVEAMNARTDMERNERAMAFAEKHDLAVTGGSDAHSSGEVGAAWTQAVAADIEGFRKAIERKATSVGGNVSHKSVRVFSTLAKARPWRP